MVQWTFDTSRKLTQNIKKKNWEKFVFIFGSAAERKVFQTQKALFPVRTQKAIGAVEDISNSGGCRWLWKLLIYGDKRIFFTVIRCLIRSSGPYNINLCQRLKRKLSEDGVKFEFFT